MMRNLFLVLICLTCWFGFAQKSELPEGFVYVKEKIPDVVLEMRYAGNNNFIGKTIPGYNKPVAILTEQAAEALFLVQQELKNEGYCLKIFDAYRPQQAVNEFITWARDSGDTLMKQDFYPDVDKRNLFNYGYISSRSGHSRGSTIDLTLVDANTGKEIDMGGSYDFFGDLSHHNSPEITAVQKQNRELLKNAMVKHGFYPYLQEWWHYTFRPEPYPDTYFNFPVE